MILEPQSTRPIRPLSLFLRLTGLGLLGVLSLLPTAPSLLKNLPPNSPPLPVLLVITSLQTMLLIAASAALGTWLAPKVGFEAPVLAGRRPFPSLRRFAIYPLLYGAATGGAMVATDLLFRPDLPAQLYMAAQKPAIGDLLPALFYGGFGEEILVRWGLMTLITWVLYRLVSRGKGPVRAAIVWVGIVGAALLFGMGHLPAARLLVGSLTAPLIVRTLLLNGMGAVLFGWLYARRGLESAMLAHMGAHLGMFLLRVLFAG